MPRKNKDEKQLPMFDCPLPKIERRRSRDIPSTTLRQELERFRKRGAKSKQPDEKRVELSEVK